MADIGSVLRYGASLVTPAVVEKHLRQVPLWKVTFTQIDAPKFPHLVNQLQFLANVVEDFAEGVYREISYNAMAEAVFALMHAHQTLDQLPGTFPELEQIDISSIVRAVLLQNRHQFARYAEITGMDWDSITSQR